MERHDETARTAEEAAAERIEHEHPARPEQTHDEGFERGYDQKRDTPEEELEPNYAQVERRFSEGIERSPTSE